MNGTATLPRLQREKAFALPIRVLQFGQGNFLRAFVDWQLDVLNERCCLDFGVVIVRPTSRSTAALLDTQGGCYTTVLRGVNAQGVVQTDVRRIGCVQRELDLGHHFADYLALARNPDVRFVVSNTTEAGITTNTTDGYGDQPPQSFPAKLTRWLHERFLHFHGDPTKGLVLLPCELVEANGAALRGAVLHFCALWQLAPAYRVWLELSCHFCSTLVDRIVTGYPTDEAVQLQADLGYQDAFLVAGEQYHYWAIEAPPWVAEELPLQRAGLNVQWVEDLAPIRLRKVAILNGAHTVLAAIGLQAGVRTVGEAMQDPQIEDFLQAVLAEEIIPALPFDEAGLQTYAGEALRRFRNPHIQHPLQAIALNMASKCVTRLLPQVVRFEHTRGHFPPRLVLALAAAMQGLSEPADVLHTAVIGIAGLADALAAARSNIQTVGVRQALQGVGAMA
ncbi:tagaturonate reductase [Rhodoferax sp. AJA081-3]|uniref:tagaturonate reductase n=1 Tax=Rhodoferax sp. AJA081-3 TaxID=2752316 RepID=UPI001AE01CB8|nr:tagaturonate reductase [Rhodoferax sp. AJA081-3]QTN26318.1 tagaturonate reductase [Rhodoferax sp. AJA081-3]